MWRHKLGGGVLVDAARRMVEARAIEQSTVAAFALNKKVTESGIKEWTGNEQMDECKWMDLWINK